MAKWLVHGTLNTQVMGSSPGGSAKPQNNFFEQEINSRVCNSLKGCSVCYHAYVICAHKRTRVDRQNAPNHRTST